MLKKILFYCLAVCLLNCAWIDNAFAEKSVENIRYVVEQTAKQEIFENTILRHVQGSDPVYFHFSADEKICKEQYGNSAYLICGRTLQNTLPTAKDIQIIPAIEGNFEWQSEFSLAFYPKEEWMPDTKYRIEIGEKSLPRLMKITNPIQFTTQGLKPVVNGEFKFDPENSKSMFVTGEIYYNYRINQEILEKEMRIAAKQDNAIQLGKLETDFHNNVLYFSVSVLNIHEEAENIFVHVPGLQALSGGKTGNPLEYAVKIPAKSEIFRLIGVETGIENLPDMSAKQNIVVEFSLPVSLAQFEGKIEALLLPRNKVQNNVQSADEKQKKPPYTWWSLNEISNDVLAKSENLPLEIIDGQDKDSRFLVLAPTYAVEAGRCAYIIIKAPVQSKKSAGAEDFAINHDMVLLVEFSSLESTVKILQQGSMLSLKGDKKLSVYARNASELHYTVRQIRPEYVHDMARLQNSRQLDEHALDMMSIIYEGKIPLAYENSEKAQFASLDLASFMKDDKGFFHVTLEAFKDDDFVGMDSRFVMLTDIGMIAKIDEQEENPCVYLLSLENGKPLKRAKLDVVGANGISLYTGVSDKNGKVQLPDLKGYDREKRVTALVASYRNDMAVMPYRDYELLIQPKNHINTAGKVFSRESLNGFAFTQRDIYRAGETAHFGFILKQGNLENIDIQKIPLMGAIYSSNGQMLEKKPLVLSASGLGEFSAQIPDRAINGQYWFQIEKADNSVVLRKYFNVMDFQPDTIKAHLQNDLQGKKLWYTKDELKNLLYSVNVENLFGAAAINATVNAKFVYSPMDFASLPFDGQYKEFSFYDAYALERGRTEDLGTFHTDEQGQAEIKINTDFLGKESIAVILQAEARDNQSGSVLTLKNLVNSSPLSAVMGYKTQSNLAYLTQDEEAKVSLIALDSQSLPYALGELRAELYQSDLVKSLTKVQGKYQYTKVRKDTLLSSKSVTLGNKVLDFVLDTTQVGDKLLVFKDKNERIVLQLRYTVAGDSLVQFDTYNSADLLANIDKYEYKAGDTVRIFLKTPYKGAGLITIERDKVYAEKWFTAEKGNSVQEIEIPELLVQDNEEGKAYLNVLYFRNIDDEEIFVEPCASVVLPFVVDMAKHRLDMDLQVAGKDKDFVAKPGQEFSVRVSTKEKAQLIVYAVDEGISQLSGYQKPDPLKEFFLDRALSVQTYQYLEKLMPEFGLMQKELAKFGGDMFMSAKMANSMRSIALNPFKVKNRKPAVFWSGLLDVGGKNGKAVEVKIPVPDTFNGNLRVYAVALSENGNKMNVMQKDVYCQADIVIQPQLPLFVTPGDEFEASIFLTDMRQDKKGKNLVLQAVADNSFEILGNAELPVILEENKENRIRFRFKVKDEDFVLGEHEFVFTIHDEKADLSVSMPVMISVRPASVLYHTVQIGQLAKEQEFFVKDVSLERSFYPQFAEISASVSEAPVPYVQALLQRMEGFAYPHTMQEVARTMPLLLLLEHREFAPLTEEFSESVIREKILQCLQLLEKRYHYRDVFSAWDHYGTLSGFELAFILDFLTTAQEQGILVNSSLMENVLRSMQDYLATMPTSLEEARAYAYGAWGLTRNGIITSYIMANLTTWLEQNERNWEQDIVGSLMAASMKLMMQDELADELVASYVPVTMDKWEELTDFDRLCERALYVEIISRYYKDKLYTEKVQAHMQEIYQLLQEYFMHSSESLASRSIMGYAISQPVKKLHAKLAFLDSSGKEIQENIQGKETELLVGIQMENIPEMTQIKSVHMEADNPAFYQLSIRAYDRKREQVEANPAFSVSREFRDIDGYPVNEWKVGDEIVVAIKVRSNTGRTEKVLVTDILSSAFEFVHGQSAQGANGQDLRTPLGKSNSDILAEEQEMQVEFAEAQQDRLMVLADVGTWESVFRYKVRVNNKGNFVLPDISVQSVQNPLLVARDLTAYDTRIVVEQ